MITYADRDQPDGLNYIPQELLTCIRNKPMYKP
nr:MAG TPA: hypothetical protein [Caudoviricetes sp.]DAY56398.1 MAG TPA: hypothetical protein [Caudoviricetes sp.]DAY60968.1 MAG TPA: hypothetical protein [Caudoviricetes sp.]